MPSFERDRELVAENKVSIKYSTSEQFAVLSKIPAGQLALSGYLLRDVRLIRQELSALRVRLDFFCSARRE